MSDLLRCSFGNQFASSGAALGSEVDHPARCLDQLQVMLHDNDGVPRLHKPLEVRVMVSPSDDRDGRPVLVAHHGETHTILHSVGPERIAGEWWRDHLRTRDYFDVEDDQGRRFWIFRVQENGKWFLQGEFE